MSKIHFHSVVGKSFGIIASLIFASSSQSAFAQEDTSEEVPASNWDGLYFGFHAGAAWLDTSNDLLVQALPELGLDDRRDSVTQDDSGFVGGLQVGGQIQTGQVVLGLEGSFTFLDREGVAPSTLFEDRTRTLSVDELILLDGRAGYAFDRSMIYARGGYAIAEVRFTSNVTSTGQLTSVSEDEENGWNAGAGYEYRLGNGLVAGVQYDYVSIGANDRNNVSIAPFNQSNHENIEVDLHLVTARLSYKF